MGIIEALWESFGSLLVIAIALTFFVPPVGLFLLTVLFLFAYPVLFVALLVVWPISIIIRLATDR